MKGISRKWEAEQKYSLLREESYRLAEQAFSPIDPLIRLEEITDHALDQSEKWASMVAKDYAPDWDWRAELKRFRSRPRRVEVAIWQGSSLLCGLSLGRVSDKHVTATIHLLQGNPSLLPPLKGKVAQMATDYLRIYALICNCQVMVIDTPAPGLIDFYKKLGFKHEIRKGKRILRLTQPVKV